MSLFNYIRSISKPAYGLSPALFEEKEREEINKNEFSDKTEIK